MAQPGVAASARGGQVIPAGRVLSPSHPAQHQKKRSDAETAGILGLGLIAAGAGAYFLLRQPSAPPSGGLAITTNAIPGMTLGTPYSATLQATGGATPYSWSVVGGSLPPGIALSTSGTLSGTPSQLGSFTFTVQVQDSAGNQAQASIPAVVTGASVSCPAPGTLVQPSGGAGIYIVDANGALDPIASKSAFDACGYAANQVQIVDPSVISGCPQGPVITGPPCPAGPMGSGYPGPNCPMGPGLLAQEAGNPAVWYADCGTGPGGSGCQKHLVEASAFYGPCGWSRQRLYPVAAAILAMTPTGAPIYDCTQVQLYSCG